MQRVSTIAKLHLCLLIALAAAALVALPAPAAADDAPTSQTLQNLRVEGQFFTTCLRNHQRRVWVKDPNEARYLVMVCSATVPTDGRLRTPDFTLRYKHSDGKEDRSRCTGISVSNTHDPKDIYDLGTYAIGDYSSIAIDKGRRIFALAFYVEADVREIQVYRLGVAEPLVHRVGATRQYSVFVTTNGDIAQSNKARKTIEQGDYQVVRVSDGLVADQTGITIHYMEGAEAQAREISQRMMIAFGRTPKLEKMELASDQDIVVWIGK